MLRFASVALVFAGLCLAAQDSDTARKFVGEWNAKLKDKTVCTIRLRPGDPVSGQFEDCNINIGEDGELREPEADSHAEKSSPILNPQLQGSKLTFEEKDGEDTIRFEFALVGERRAELKIVGAPVDVKPIPFSRQ